MSRRAESLGPGDQASDVGSRSILSWSVLSPSSIFGDIIPPFGGLGRRIGLPNAECAGAWVQVTARALAARWRAAGALRQPPALHLNSLAGAVDRPLRPVHKRAYSNDSTDCRGPIASGNRGESRPALAAGRPGKQPGRTARESQVRAGRLAADRTPPSVWPGRGLCSVMGGHRRRLRRRGGRRPLGDRPAFSHCSSRFWVAWPRRSSDVAMFPRDSTCPRGRGHGALNLKTEINWS
jgi:hypothetical protein